MLAQAIFNGSFPAMEKYPTIYKGANRTDNDKPTPNFKSRARSGAKLIRFNS